MSIRTQTLSNRLNAAVDRWCEDNTNVAKDSHIIAELKNLLQAELDRTERPMLRRFVPSREGFGFRL